jgi:hypothetical protein
MIALVRFMDLLPVVEFPAAPRFNEPAPRLDALPKPRIR